MIETHPPLSGKEAGFIALAVACALLPFVFNGAGANWDRIETEIAFWGCGAVCAGIAALIQERRWRRWVNRPR